MNGKKGGRPAKRSSQRSYGALAAVVDTRPRALDDVLAKLLRAARRARV
jgi:hypothetical protein